MSLLTSSLPALSVRIGQFLHQLVDDAGLVARVQERQQGLLPGCLRPAQKVRQGLDRRCPDAGAVGPVLLQV